MGKAERKPIPKKMRFEVFKRDKFTCQYCGRTSPEVILEVDHIKPIYEGGDNNIINLITSCRDCNRGKGKTRIDDNAEIQKQNERLKEVAEKKEQLEMLMEWRNELLDFEDYQINQIDEVVIRLTNRKRRLTDNGKIKIRELISRFGFEEVLNSVEIAIKQYGEFDEFAFNKIGGICYQRKKQKEDKRLYYFNYVKKSLLNKYGRYPASLKDFIFEHLNEEDEEEFDFLKEVLADTKTVEDFWRTIKEVIP